jgi:hypothetical protein
MELFSPTTLVPASDGEDSGRADAIIIDGQSAAIEHTHGLSGTDLYLSGLTFDGLRRHEAAINEDIAPGIKDDLACRPLPEIICTHHRPVDEPHRVTGRHLNLSRFSTSRLDGQPASVHDDIPTAINQRCCRRSRSSYSQQLEPCRSQGAPNHQPGY